MEKRNNCIALRRVQNPSWYNLQFIFKLFESSRGSSKATIQGDVWFNVGELNSDDAWV